MFCPLEPCRCDTHSDYNNLSHQSNRSLQIYIECGDCQRAASRSCKNLLCAFDTAGAPVIVPVHDVEYLFSTTVDKSECRAILTKANFCELYKGWIDEHIRDPHACPLNDLYVSWEIPEPCAARIFLNR